MHWRLVVPSVLSIAVGIYGHDHTRTTNRILIEGVVQEAGTHESRRAAVRIGTGMVTTDEDGRFSVLLESSPDSLRAVLLDEDGHPRRFVRTVLLKGHDLRQILVRAVAEPPTDDTLSTEQVWEFVRATLLDGPINPARPGIHTWRRWSWPSGPPTIAIVAEHPVSKARFDRDFVGELRRALIDDTAFRQLTGVAGWTFATVSAVDALRWQPGPGSGVPYLEGHIVIAPKTGRPSHGGAWDQDGDGRLESGFVLLRTDTFSRGALLHELMHALGIGHAPDHLFGLSIMRGPLEFTDVDEWLISVIAEETFDVGEPVSRIFGVKWPM